ncbi:MAG: HEAT repeat domain-containing protein [Oscillochloris sp.]|nr:HEAT repeat domain-containing protein [Oscillochloris sp.]
MSQMPEAIGGLITDLCTGDEFQRIQASFALGVLGEPAVAPLIQLLSSPEQELRKRAAWVLGVIGAPALPDLLRMAEDDDTQMRIEAIRVLGVVGEARALKQLLLGLTDTDPHVAARSARALGKIGDSRAYHPLVTAMHHPMSDVRYEACRAVVDLRVPDGVTALRELALEDHGITSWGASVSEGAHRAMVELESVLAAPAHDDDFLRASQLLRRQQFGDEM